MNRPVFSCSPAFTALFCLLVFLDTECFVPYFMLAAALHELGHLTVLWLYDLYPAHFYIGLLGAVISVNFPNYLAELLTALAGPMVNLLLFCVCFRLLPLFSYFNLYLLLYNLIPIYPLDGGRLLRLGLTHWFRFETAFRIEQIVSILTVCALVAVGIYTAIFLRLGLFPLLSLVFLLKLPSLTCQSQTSMLQ